MHDRNATPPPAPAVESPRPTPGPKRSTRLLLLAAAAAAAAMMVGPRLFGGPGGAAPTPAAPGALRPGGACAAGTAPAHASASFDRGALTAALSSDKVLASAPSEVYLSVDLSAAALAANADRPGVDLALVIDRSGSMAGEKLASAKRAAHGIVARLGAGDRVTLIQYDNTAERLVPLVKLDRVGRDWLDREIDAIVERGGTNLHAGMVLGQLELARAVVPGRVNREVLLSDGQANQGITDRAALARIAGGAADKGLRLTTVGLGLDYNEDLMEALAENGRGRYYYVKDAASLESVFAGELENLQATVATATELRLVPACAGVEVLSVVGYETRRDGAATVVPMVDLFGGDSRRLMARLRVPAGGQARADLVRVELRYTDARTQRPGGVTLALGAQMTDDAVAVQAAADPEVLANVVQVESAAAMRTAASAWEQGDRGAARAALEQNAAQMQGLAQKYKIAPAKMQRALAEPSQLAADIDTYAVGSMGSKHSLKLRKGNARAQMQSKW
jgi:Ca-activated chloride channel family protein